MVHLAELSNDPLGELNERTTYQINHHGSRYVGAGMQPTLATRILVKRVVPSLTRTSGLGGCVCSH